MTIKFNLLFPTAETSSIRAIVYYGGYKLSDEKITRTPFRRTLPWKVPTKLWDKNAQQLKKNKSFKDTDNINQAIVKIKSELQEYELRTRLDSIVITETGIQEAFENVIRPPKTNLTPIYFTQVFAKLIEESESGQRTTKEGKRISDGTLRRYRLSLWHFENFEEKRGDVKLTDLKKEIGSDLQKYFNDQNLAHNTKVNHLRTYIAVYNYAIEKGWMQPTDFHKVRLAEEESDTIALTEEEVDAIFNLKLASEPSLELIRDTFIIGVWTLMRYGDYSSIKTYNIQGQLLRVNTTKTDVQVVLPIHHQLQKVLDRYSGKLPSSPSEPVFNREIKNIAKRAGITRLEEKRENKGGKTTKKIIPRYERISSHTARRTGATLLYLQGIPKKQIMLFTGHKKDEHFDRYIRIGAYANAKMLVDHDIFKEKEELPTKASQFKDGYYWALRAEEKEVVKIESGKMLFFKQESLSIDIFLNQGGKILSKVN